MAGENNRSEGRGKLAVAALVVGALAISGFYDLGHFDHNDFQYGVTPVLLRRYTLYRDFSFDQTPLEAWLGLVVLRLVGAPRLYLTLRVISLLCVWGAVWLGIAICRAEAGRGRGRDRGARKAAVTMLFLAGFIALQPLVVIGGEIGNYSLGLVLSAAALWCYWRHRQSSFAVGLLAGLAVAAKLSNVYAAAGFGLLYLAGARRWRNSAWFGAGAVLGVTPILYYLIRAPRLFRFENVTYHYLIAIYRGVAFHIALWPLLLAAALVLAAAPLLWAEAWAIVVLLAAAMIGLVTPGILFPQYWAPPDFLLLLLGCLIFARRLETRGRAAATVLSAALALAVVQGVAMIDEAWGEARAGNYGVVAVTRLRHQISAVMAPIDPGCHDDLISAFATPAVGTGLGIAPISAEGPFMMRLDPVLRSHAAWFRDYSDVPRYLAPNSLIMVGYDPGTDYETAMRSYAAEHRFVAVVVGGLFGKEVVMEMPKDCRK